MKGTIGLKLAVVLFAIVVGVALVNGRYADALFLGFFPVLFALACLPMAKQADKHGHWGSR